MFYQTFDTTNEPSGPTETSTALIRAKHRELLADGWTLVRETFETFTYEADTLNAWTLIFTKRASYRRGTEKLVLVVRPDVWTQVPFNVRKG